MLRRPLGGLGLLLSLHLLTTAAAAPFISAQATVVLLSGLPGDLESENTYRDQLQNWLQLLQVNKQVRKVIVLCDHPESVRLPARMAGQVLKADRKTFLSLGQTLSGTTNALVLIAWGHGGNQGATPVLHVRGPRLSPADFQTLAAQVPAAQSHWVLLFRGSGAFASQLAGPSRQILSSEAQTTFTSDPVGMAVLVKLARTNPTREFSQLAEEFGRATSAWYAERNLARTEEPTLWAADEKPRLLAPTVAASGASSLGEPEPAEVAAAQGDASGGEPAKTPAEAAPSQLPPKELVTAWEGITRVDPQQYPEADGVILRRHVRYTLASNPAIVSEQDEFIQVLTPEGKRFGDFDVSYSPPYEEIHFLECEVLRPDGELLRLDPDAIREAVEKSVGDYQVGRRKIFSLPGIVPGAVLHVRYRTQWKHFPLPQISLEIPIGQEMAAVESTVQISVPKEAAFHFALERVKAAAPEVSESPYGATYTWKFSQLPAYQREILVAPRQRPRLMISTFPNWQEFAAWYSRITQLSDTLTPEIAAKAKELTQGATTDREKVLALYNYVTSLRYVAVPMGVNSFRPHAAANVLENQFGDCKDKANLFNALLHALNLEAHLVLVPRFSQAHETVPGLAFNHAISRVILGNQTLWVDTTDEVCRFGMLPPGDPGRKVLVIDGKTSTLTQLPQPNPREHVLQLAGEVSCLSPSDALPVRMSLLAFGYPDYQLRSTAQESKDLGVAVPLLGAAFRPVIGSFALDKQSASRVSALDENFSWKAEGSSVGLLADSGRDWVLHSPFWLPQEWDQALHRRQAALFLNQGYPLTLEQEFTFALPPRAQPLALPVLNENTAAPLRWRIEWKQSGKDKLVARFRAEMARGELSVEETPQFQKQLRALLGALSSSATLARPQ